MNLARYLLEPNLLGVLTFRFLHFISPGHADRLDTGASDVSLEVGSQGLHHFQIMMAAFLSVRQLGAFLPHRSVGDSQETE